MAPPAKRRKRNVLESSSDEYEEPTTKRQPKIETLISSPSTPRDSKAKFSGTAPVQTTISPTFGRAKTSNHHNAAPIYLGNQVRGNKSNAKSASNSPEKSKRKAKVEEKGRSADLFTLFTKQAERQQAEGSGSRVSTMPKVAAQNIKNTQSYEEEDDIISDDDWTVGRGKLSSIVGQAAKRRATGTEPVRIGGGEAPNASQKFRKVPKTIFTRNQDDLRPWAERFAPLDLDELAVHKRKVADVRGWLEEVFNGRMRQRLLLLKGGAGIGKTTTISLLAKAMDFDILEWRNPVGSVATSDGYQSMAAQFEEFMGRGGKFGQLDLLALNEGLNSQEVKPLDRRKQIILVEEFPNTFTRASSALQSFRSTILQYLASNTPQLSAFYSNKKTEQITPVVMIVSETLLTTTSASADSFTAHRLLGPEILQHPGMGVIEFNAIAPTILAKALELVIQKESRKSGRRKTPGPLVLRKLGEVGDIRSAIGSLEFLCLRGDSDGDWGGKVTFGKAKKISKDTALTEMEEKSLELVTRREASLGIFHAVGKVVYNKREEPADRDVERLPDYLSLNSRPRKSEICVEELIDETGTDTQTFIAALHENYILSCDASTTSFDYSSLDHVNGCIDALSDSDLLCPDWDGSINSTSFGGGNGGRGTGGDIIRQDEMSFQIAIRGILFSLPYPVKRHAPAAAGFRPGKRGDEFKMFYPTSLKLWRMKEEIESTIDMWVTLIMKGEGQNHSITSGAAAFARPKVGTVESWKSARTSNPKSPKPSTARSAGSKDVEAAPLMAVGTSARKEMLLERLPYMLFIAKARKMSSSTLAIRDMEKVTKFHGIGGPSTETPDDGEVDEKAVGEEWATDKPGEEKSPRKKKLVIRGRGEANGLPLGQPLQEQKLVLSDDDIED
jgi:cell cycle checkpoint protein